MTIKKMVVIRGISGSGKSTYVRNNFPDAFVCSADHYFYDIEGNYNFDASKLSFAHKSCQQNFHKALREKKPLIVIDNTNTKKWEFMPYIKAAKKAGYDIEIIKLDTPVSVATERNVHGVPEDVVQRMYNRMEELPIDLQHKEKVVKGV